MERSGDDLEKRGLEVLRAVLISVLVVAVTVVIFMALTQPFDRIFSNIVYNG